MTRYKKHLRSPWSKLYFRRLFFQRCILADINVCCLLVSVRPQNTFLFDNKKKAKNRLIIIMMNIFIYCVLCFRWTTQAKVRGFLQEQESNGTPDERFWDPELDHTSRSSVWSQYHLRSTLFLPKRWTRLSQVCCLLCLMIQYPCTQNIV